LVKLAGLWIAIQEREQANTFALLSELASYFEDHQTAGRMPGKVVGARWLKRTELAQIIAAKDGKVRLVYLDPGGQLQTVHRAIWTKFGR
jgi:hypothetical protein